MPSFFRSHHFCILFLFGMTTVNQILSRESKNKSLTSKRFLKIAAEHWSPFFEITEDSNGNVSYSGIMWTALNFFATAMNFEYEILRPPDGQWGVRNENGEWNGMLGMVKRNEVDFALGPFAVIYEREQACDFTVPIDIDYWAVIVPIQPHQNYWIILRPFGLLLWLSLGLTTLLYTTILIISDITFFGLRIGHKHIPKIISFTYRNILGEPSEWAPDKFIYQRIFSAVWMLSLIIIAKSYSGTLASLLVVPNIPIPINSVQDLVNQDELPWFIEKGSVLDQLGQMAAPHTTFYKLYDGAKKRGNIGANCVNKRKEIRKGLFGSVCERTSIDKLISDDFSGTGECKLYVGEINLFATSFAMAFQEGSQLLPETNQWILNILQKGLYSKWYSESIPNKTSCTGIKAIKSSMAKNNHSQTLNDTFGLFIILFLGLGLSTLAFIIEKRF
ncbi:glutamate receptor ionotropic, delta-2-like [Lepeophtheirus salmonis]|uniref:glutamate receptor ionotropic, delta-2-like n=1 Tax=Lepeophtheirus salmonis TaxID=72036 RepID=UPI003AF40598